jgi:hypothetical protein
MSDPIKEILVEGGKILFQVFVQESVPKVKKLLGSSYKYIKDKFKGDKWESREDENIAYILDQAAKMIDEKKLDTSGDVPPRILKEVLFEGAFTEDDLTSNYFAGILASSRTSKENDDRAVSMAKLISMMSSVELRLHYIAYSVLYKLLHDKRIDINTVLKSSRIFISVSDLIRSLDIGHNEHYFDKISFSMTMTEKNGLLNILGWLRVDDFNNASLQVKRYLEKNRLLYFPRFFEKGENQEPMSDEELMTWSFGTQGLLYRPTIFGLTLYMWVNGFKDLSLSSFAYVPIKFNENIKLPQTAFPMEEFEGL